MIKKPIARLEQGKLIVNVGAGLGVQSVKLPADSEIPKGVEDLVEVELDSPEACIVGREIYVRANGLKAH